MKHALENLKIIDLTRVLGGPYATQILADHGADVIKVEAHTIKVYFHTMKVHFYIIKGTFTLKKYTFIQ